MVKNIAIGAALVISLVALFLPVGKESRTVVERLGALNTPDLQIGGVRLMSAAMSPNQATSSAICSLQSPSSTSTLISASVVLTTATSGATTLLSSKSITQYGTNTASVVLNSQSIASGAQAGVTLASSTHNQTAINDRVFPPNYHLVVTQTGAGILNQSGQCEAVWHVY